MRNEEIWESAFSSFDAKKDDQGLLSASGKYRYNSSLYKFSITRQKSGSYLYRGTVSVIGKTGKVLKKRKKKSNAEETDLGPMFGSPKPEFESISTKVYSNSGNVDDIKACIIRGVQRLYSNNPGAISANMSNNIRPDRITPAVAAELKLEKYVVLAHKNASSETQHNIVLRIRRLCGKLPNIPMASFKKTKLTQLMDDMHVGRDTRKDLAGFWTYCCEMRICDGKCPVDVPPKYRKSSHAKQLGVKRIDRLTLEQQDMLYAECRKRIGSFEVGEALMLGTGLSPKSIEKMTWHDLIFHEEYDYVEVTVLVDRLSGATHNFTKPVAPQAAEILHKRFDTLVSKYGMTKVKKMPLISVVSNPEKQMSASTLITHATQTLQRLFKITNKELALLRNEDPTIAAATKVFHNSYVDALYSACNLAEDPGTATFLQGKSFGADPSNDNYIAYTDKYGSRRLYYILQCLAEDKKIKRVPDVTYDDGFIVRTYTPDSKREDVSIICDIYLEPGEEITLDCLHGVSGVIESYQVGDKGRRKKITDQIEMVLPS